MLLIKGFLILMNCRHKHPYPRVFLTFPIISLFSVQSFCKLLSSQKDDNWPLPMMYSLCLDLRIFAAKADLQLEHSGGKPGSFIPIILAFFSLTQTIILRDE
jgi:hypothetical protein